MKLPAILVLISFISLISSDNSTITQQLDYVNFRLISAESSLPTFQDDPEAKSARIAMNYVAHAK